MLSMRGGRVEHSDDSKTYKFISQLGCDREQCRSGAGAYDLNTGTTGVTRDTLEPHFF